MRKIKRFVLNDSFTVLSAEAQKNVLGGEFFPYSCGSITSQSTCSGECISGVIKYGETDYAGYCTWNSSTSTCFCGNLQPWP